MARSSLLILAVLAALVPALAFGQGVLVVVDSDVAVPLPRPIIIWPPHPPHPPHPPYPPPVWPRPRPEPPVSYKVNQVEVQAKIANQVASVQVSQTFENTGSGQIEASFVFPLPYDGAIEQMTLMVDGKEFPAKLLKADEARKIYEDIVRKNRDPALLEWIGTGMFKTSVFPVPPGAKRTVSLRYSQLLRQSDGLTDFLFPLSTAKYSSKPVEKIDLRVSIESGDDIKNIYSPTHPVEIKRPDEKHAVVSYSSKNEVPTADFRLFFDVGKEKLSTRVISYRPDKGDDGYFLLLTTPQIKAAGDERPAKTVLFIIDRSGSMSGKKIEQVRAALKDVLNKLRPGDLFNIIAYDSQVEAFRPELQRFDENTRKAALGFVEGLYAGGSTNIEGALKAGLAQLQDEKRPTYVIFLTDGLPTAGETNEAKIIEAAKGANKIRARIFSFGVGYDVNSRLLDRLVRENFGQSMYVRPEEDIESHVGKLYARIESPVLTDVKLNFAFDAKPEEGAVVNRVYPKGSFDLFAGEQLVVVGRYKKPGDAKVMVSGRIGDKEEKIDFPAALVEHSTDETNGFIEKLWAGRRIGEILDEIDLKGKNDELIKELVALSTRHGILTPYTSFMADDSVNIHRTAENARRASDRLDALAATDGSAGVAQRAMKGALQGMGAAGPAAPAADMSLHRFAAEAAAAPGGRGGAGDDRAYKLAEESKREADAVVQNVRQLGNRTFYRRDKQWIDSRITPEQENQARRVKQFSDEYFELARRHGRALAQYLAFDEPVLLAVGNEAYLIEP